MTFWFMEKYNSFFKFKITELLNIFTHSPVFFPADLCKTHNEKLIILSKIIIKINNLVLINLLSILILLGRREDKCR